MKNRDIALMSGGTKEDFMEEVAFGGSFDGGFQETKIGIR